MRHAQRLFPNRWRKQTSSRILVLVNMGFPKASNQNYSSVTNSTPNMTRKEALKRYGLSDLNLTWPEKAESHLVVDYTYKNPTSIEQMYGESDLSALPIFEGGFINFGYWPNPIPDGHKITKEERTACSEQMYRVIADLANILPHNNILDVGCGLGYGDAFISSKYKPKLVVGVDISPDQIARAKLHQVSGIRDGKLRFTIGEAGSLPFTASTFDYIFSIEAAQHFESMRSFSEEAARILKPDGKLVMTSFFPTSVEGKKALNAIVPDYHIHGSQHTVEEVQEVQFSI